MVEGKRVRTKAKVGAAVETHLEQMIAEVEAQGITAEQAAEQYELVVAQFKGNGLSEADAAEWLTTAPIDELTEAGLATELVSRATRGQSLSGSNPTQEWVS
jgi:hypothetical protein